ncbi:Protein CLEC16A-like [Vitis vinifera]|uniref:Protein CLEC16A-like n=1 Tax=Vitis vinifera TaxID=29760 RepID=A0A438E9L6_VITVI|nr:Protein CLEC16A-like [Vitis vinifera]
MCIVQHVESPGMRFEGGKLDNLPVSSIDCFLNRMSGLQDVVVAFPLYSEALKFAYHGEKMIQIAVRALTLNIYNVSDAMVYQFVTSPPVSEYFSDLVQSLREQCFHLDALVHDKEETSFPEKEKELRMATDKIVDDLYYFKDILGSNIFLRNYEAYKEAWLVELRDSSGEEGVWSPRFSRSFNDWEVEEVERLLLTIRGRRLNPLLEDKRLWKETKDGIFLVKSLYSALFSRSVVQFPNSIIWSHWCPYQINWVLPLSVRDTLLGWRGFNMGKKRRKGSDLSAVTCLYVISRLLQVVGGKSVVNSLAGIILYPFMTSSMRDTTRGDSGNGSFQDKSFVTHLNKLEMQCSGLESEGAENIERNCLFGHLLDYISSNSHFVSCPWDNKLGERSGLLSYIFSDNHSLVLASLFFLLVLGGSKDLDYLLASTIGFSETKTGRQKGAQFGTVIDNSNRIPILD